MTMKTPKNAQGKYNRSGKAQAALADAASGVVASLISTLLIYPMDSYKTQVQAETSTSTSKHISNRQLKRKKLYSGLKMKLGHVTCSNFAYFFLYSWLTPKKKGGSLQKLWTSALAAMLNTILTLPLDVISSRQQVHNHHRASQTKTITNTNKLEEENEEKKEESQAYDGNDDGASLKVNNHQIPSTFDITSKGPQTSSSWRYDYHRITDLWSGLFPSLLLCSNPSIHYTAYETLKDIILSSRPDQQQLTMSQAFRLGFVAKFIATIITYPLIRAKVILMTTSNEATKKRNDVNDNDIIQNNSLKSTLQHIFHTQGWRGFYKGCSLQLLQTIFKSALLMMFRELITNGTRKLLIQKP